MLRFFPGRGAPPALKEAASQRSRTSNTSRIANSAEGKQLPHTEDEDPQSSPASFDASPQPPPRPPTEDQENEDDNEDIPASQRVQNVNDLGLLTQDLEQDPQRTTEEAETVEGSDTANGRRHHNCDHPEMDNAPELQVDQENDAEQDKDDGASEPSPFDLDWVPDEGADLEEYELTEADALLDSVYGDHAHSNDGRHLNGGIEDDTRWQARWIRMVQHVPQRYVVPRGKVGRRFLIILTSELRGVRERSWNSERPLIFIATMLQREEGIIKAKDIRLMMSQRMDLWEAGHFPALIDNTEGSMLSSQRSKGKPVDSEREARSYNTKVLSGRLRKAVRDLTSRGNGGVLQPSDTCTKSGRPVMDVLKEKHPPLREPPLIGTKEGSFEPMEDDEWTTPIPVNVSSDIIESVATRLTGAAGPDGVDSVDLKHWLLRFGKESEALRQELAHWTDWLANHHPPWAAYRALMAGRLVALDKQPGVRPLGIGSIFRRLMAKSVIKVIGRQATHSCGSLNLCAGLPAGIEGAVHAMSTVSHPLPNEDDNPLPPPPPEENEAPRPPNIPFEPAEPSGTLLVDARNGFNELSRKAMLWTVRRLWPNGALFSFNCYKHSSLLIVREKGGPCHILLSHEGVTQGDPLSMLLYGITLSPLTDSIQTEEQSVLQAWYADDAAMGGRIKGIANAMTLLLERGPARGYFPEPEKSIFVPSVPAEMEECKSLLQEFNFQYKEGARYVGGFIGSKASQEEWIAPMIEAWTNGVKKLASVAKRYPQTAFAGLTKSLQSEWAYLQRVIPDAGEIMQPIEEALEEAFIPALFGESDPAIARLRIQLSLAVKKAGLGIPNPTLTAQQNHSASKQVTASLTTSLLERSELNTSDYINEATTLRQDLRKQRIEADAIDLETIIRETTSKVGKLRLKRATKTGAWLTAMPDRLNGTELAADEFRDSLRIRFGLLPLSLPKQCDGCHEKFSVEHAMSCKKGGLILLRHNDLANEWHELCAHALSPSAVSDEPLIHNGQGINNKERGQTSEPEMELRGDVAAHGFWKRGSTAIFDIRVTDVETPSQRGTDPGVLLKRHEEEKKKKYSKHCEKQRKHFTPLVFSTDGLLGVECEAASKRLASQISSKWHRTYSEVCGFVRSRLAIALVRSASRCLRWDRNPLCRKSQIPWDSGSGLSLYN